MKIFFIDTTKEKVEEFESYRMTIKLRKNTDETKEILLKLLETLNDRKKINLLVTKHSSNFSSSPVKWEMEYDIANKILGKEANSERLTYIFELVNYLFYYLLLPEDYKITFFLLHGLTIEDNHDKWEGIINKVKSNRYVVYKGGQEFVTTHMCHMEMLDEGDSLLLSQIKAHYDLPKEEVRIIPKSGRLLVIQTARIKM